MHPSLPEFFTDLLISQYGKALGETVASGLCRRPVTLRVNTLKTDVPRVEAALSSAGIAFSHVPFSPLALVLSDVAEAQVQRLPIYENGEIYLQSLSSMLPPLLLNPAPGESLLDMAAAPGGKTTQLAAMADDKAPITACEKNPVRAQRLVYNLSKQGAGRVNVMVTDARKLDDFFSFDKVLLDAPCSGSGTVVVDEHSARGVPSQELISRSVKTQQALLKKAISLVRPGGTVVYSTCSVLREENQGVIEAVLKSSPVVIDPISPDELPSVPLLPSDIPGVLCVQPTALYEGFFCARLIKK